MADDWKKWLTAARKAWLKRPHPRLGDAVDAATAVALAAAPRPPLPASKKKADLEAWRALEAKGDALDFPRLAAAMRGGQQEDVQAHVEALATWKDPRFAAALLALLEDPPYAGVRSRGLLLAVLDALQATGDRRAAAPARELAARYLAIVASGTGAWVVLRLQLVADALEALPEVELSAADVTLCERIEQAAAAVPGAAPSRPRTTGRVRVKELLDAVYAAPDDDAPRLVLADALLEAGDAYGEFIRLQLSTPRNPAREAELLESKEVAPWIQPLALAGRCTFERGFANEVSLYRAGGKSVDEPAWRTVRTLRRVDILTRKAAVALLGGPHCGAVRDVATADGALLEALSDQPRPWTALAAQVSEPSPKVFAAFPKLKRLRLMLTGKAPWDLLAGTPELESLHLTTRDPLSASLLSPLMKLRELTVLGPGLPAGFYLPPSLVRATVPGPLLEGLLSSSALLKHLSCAMPHAHRALFAGLGQLESLELLVGGAEPDAFTPVRGVERLGLRVVKGRALPEGFLGGLASLRVLELAYTQAVFGPHLAGCSSLRAVTGFWNDLSTVPALPSLQYFHAMLTSNMDQLEGFLGRNPGLAVLDLQWNSSSPLWFSGGGDAFKQVAPAWERFAKLVKASTLQAVGVHDGLWLARGKDGAWSRVVFRKTRMAESDARFAKQLVAELGALFSFTTWEGDG